jgi:hypothetical protein
MRTRFEAAGAGRDPIIFDSGNEIRSDLSLDALAAYVGT